MLHEVLLPKLTLIQFELVSLSVVFETSLGMFCWCLLKKIKSLFCHLLLCVIFSSNSGKIVKEIKLWALERDFLKVFQDPYSFYDFFFFFLVNVCFQGNWGDINRQNWLTSGCRFLICLHFHGNQSCCKKGWINQKQSNLYYQYKYWFISFKVKWYFYQFLYYGLTKYWRNGSSSRGLENVCSFSCG